MRSRIDSRRGVTLLELVVALAVTGLVFVAARLMIETIDDSGRTLSNFARTHDASANANRLLRSLVSRAEVSPDSVRRFRGDSLSASFDTWCDAAGGWIERCRATISLGAGSDSSIVIGSLSTGDPLRLGAIAGLAELRYGERDSLGVRWLPSWGRSITAPFAIAIASERDTIVLIVGERG